MSKWAFIRDTTVECVVLFLMVTVGKIIVNAVLFLLGFGLTAIVLLWQHYTGG